MTAADYASHRPGPGTAATRLPRDPGRISLLRADSLFFCRKRRDQFKSDCSRMAVCCNRLGYSESYETVVDPKVQHNSSSS
jgi:hypothetical protein